MFDMIYDFIVHLFLLKVDEPIYIKPASQREKVFLLTFVTVLVILGVIIINQWL